jgi:hypothetical protein
LPAGVTSSTRRWPGLLPRGLPGGLPVLASRLLAAGVVRNVAGTGDRYQLTPQFCGQVTQHHMSANPTMQESFAELFEESLGRQEMRPGEVITAEVVRIDQNFVVVNAGLKSESYIELEEFLNDQGELEVKVGDFVQVAIEQLENGFGETRLSRDRAKRVAAWNALEAGAERW